MTGVRYCTSCEPQKAHIAGQRGETLCQSCLMQHMEGELGRTPEQARREYRRWWKRRAA